jgi:hypothetical protein
MAVGTMQAAERELYMGPVASSYAASPAEVGAGFATGLRGGNTITTGRRVMTINWKAKLTQLKNAPATPVDAELRPGLSFTLEAAGRDYDQYFPPGSDSTMIESNAHETWRTRIVQTIAEYDQIARLAEAEAGHASHNTPTPVPSPTDPAGIAAGVQAVQARLTAAAGLPLVSVGTQRVVQAAIGVGFPHEPRFFIDRYYRNIVPGSRTTLTFGRIEQALADAVAAVDSWLSIAGPA